MLKRLFAVLLLCSPCAAQTIFLQPDTTTITVPLGTTKTLTAAVYGVNDKGVVWSTTGGTLVDGVNTAAHVCTANGPCREGIYSLTSGTFTVTATSHANGAVLASQTVTFSGSPTLITGTGPAGHPRLIITPSEVAALQAKCTAGNPMCQELIANGITNYNNDNTIWSWTCNSGTGLPSSPQYDQPEAHALQYAQLQLLNPYPTAQTAHNWGCYAHDWYLYAANGLINGNVAMIQGSEWSQNIGGWAYTPDLLYWSGYLTSGDLTTIRTSMAVGLQQLFGQNPEGGGSPTYNNPNMVSQMNTGLGLRGLGSNYTESKLLLGIAWSSTFDDTTADDPPLTGTHNTCSATRYQMCPDFTAGSLHAYQYWFLGTFLVKWWAHTDDPGVVLSAMNTGFPSNGWTAPPTCTWRTSGASFQCMGDGVGGGPSEGTGYWWHEWTPIDMLTILHSTGLDDPRTPAQGGPAYGGPQMSAEYSSWLDETYAAQLSNLTFFGANGQTAEPGYNMITSGDTEQQDYVTTPAHQLWATSLMQLDQLQGRTDREPGSLWDVLNTSYGGPLGTSGGCSSRCGYLTGLQSDVAFNTAWPMVITQPAADPTVSLPSDPRPSLSTDSWDDSYNNHQLVRNGWSTSNAVVSLYNENTQIDHEHEYQGGFEVFQNSEYITKGRTEFDNYNNGMSAAQFRNTLGLLNTVPGTNFVGCVGDDMAEAILHGGQFWDEEQAGMTATLHSELPGYMANHVNDTNAYNGCDYGGAYNYTDVTGVSQDLLWIRGSNQIIRYGRAATGASTDKSAWLNSTGAVTVTGNAASWPTRSGTQKAKLTTLLPAAVNPVVVPIMNQTIQTGPHAVLQQGTSMQDVCTSNYADGTTGNVITSTPSLARWVSYDPSKLTVTSGGMVTAVGSVGQDAIIVCGSGVAPGADIFIGSSSSGTLTADTGTDQFIDWEPYQQVQVDAGNVASTQFLSTFEWGASSFTPTTATLVQSSAGQGYDCAGLGTTLACFMRVLGSFTGTTVAASGGTTQYFSDMTPNTAYSITGAGTPGSATSDNAGVLTFAATGTGNITVSPSGGVVAPSSLQGVVLTGGQVQ